MAQRTGGASGKRLREDTELQSQSAADEADPAERHRRISDAAYYRAERRGFAPGYEQEDWLEAEKEINAGAAGDLKPEDNRFPAPK
jgi:hypothetical protein